MSDQDRLMWAVDATLLLIAELTVLAAGLCALIAREWAWAAACAGWFTVIRILDERHSKRRPGNWND